jgi:PAS domain S-box-containing protein
MADINVQLERPDTGLPKVNPDPPGSAPHAQLSSPIAGIGAPAGGLQALVLEQMPTAAVILDANTGHLRYANRKAISLFGNNVPQVIGKRVGGQPYRTEDWPLARSLATGEVVSDEEIELMANNAARVFSVSAAPVHDSRGKTVAVVGTFLDVTQRRRGEEALADVNHRLNAAIAAAELSSAHAEEANRAKDEFIAVVSHELRTPLNTIRLWTRMLSNEKLSSKDREEGVQMINRAAVAQQQVIDDLFDVSRIAAGKLKLAFHETLLTNVIKGAVEAVEPVATARGIRMRSSVAANLGMVRADAGRLQQVIWNLLSNAVKFTPQGGTVSVNALRAGSIVAIEVQDSGIGIKHEFLPHVFDRFRQAEGGTTRTHGGLGLGLSIAKQIVDLHGGTISVASEGDGKGTTFRVELPMPTITAPDDTGEVRILDLGTRLHDLDILVVEDEASARDGLQKLLEDSGAKVRAVESAEEARDAINTRRPRLIICDIGLPGEDGYALIRDVRAQKGSHIAALAVTAFARSEDRKLALDAGFDDHLPKPVDPDRLLELAAKLVEKG